MLTALAVSLSPNAALDAAFERLAAGGAAAGGFGLAAGVVLGLNPVALPALPAVAAVLSPRLEPTRGSWRSTLRATPTVAAFVVGMDVPLAVAGYFLSWLAVALTRASVVLGVVTTTVLAATGLWLLLRKRNSCAATRQIPLHPADALAYGVFFSVSACSGCAPLLISLGSAVALLSGPQTAALVLVTYLIGRTAVLLATAALGTRLLLRPNGGRLLDVVVGLGLLAAAGYYSFLIATGRISSLLPGEPGATLLS